MSFLKDIPTQNARELADDLSQFVDRHLKKIAHLNKVYSPIQAGDMVEFVVYIVTKKSGSISVRVGDRAFVRGIKKDHAWVYPVGRKNAIKVPISNLKRWISEKA